MKKYFVLSILAANILILFFAVSIKFNNHRRNTRVFTANAIHSTDSTDGVAPKNTLVDVLEQFQEKIQNTNVQIAELASQVRILDLKNTFKRNLKPGDRGDDVRALQEILMDSPDLYTGDNGDTNTSNELKATGIYDNATKSAVLGFQSQAGMTATGAFDANTKEKFFATLAELDQENNPADNTTIDLSSLSDTNQRDNQANSATDPSDLELSIQDLQNQVLALSAQLSNVESQISDLQIQAPSQTSSGQANTSNVLIPPTTTGKIPPPPTNTQHASTLPPITSTSGSGKKP